jgi:hypothetical protein
MPSRPYAANHDPPEKSKQTTYVRKVKVNCNIFRDQRKSAEKKHKARLQYHPQHVQREKARDQKQKKINKPQSDPSRRTHNLNDIETTRRQPRTTVKTQTNKAKKKNER